MTLSSISYLALCSRLVSSRTLSSPLSSLYILSPETPLRGLWAVYRPARVAVCGVEKHRVCLFSRLLTRIVSRVFHRVISRCGCCSALCSLLCSARNCSARAARLRSRIAALLGSQLCLAGSRLFLAHGSARLDVAAALLAALGSALLATARGTSARASRLLSACGSAWPV